MLWRSTISKWPFLSSQPRWLAGGVLGNTWTCAPRRSLQRRSQSALQSTPAPASKASNAVRDELPLPVDLDPPAPEQTFTSTTQKYRHVRLLRDEGSVPVQHPDGTIVIDGLVRSVRKQKRIAFAHIADGSTLAPVQAVFNDPQLTEKYFRSITI